MLTSISFRWLSPRNGTPVLVLCALLVGGANRARADHIDTELFKKAHLIMKDLEEHGYKNVGILKFQVKKGNAAPTLMAGKLNYIMATRLENALIAKDNEKAPIGITRGASAAAAAKDKKATFLTDAGKQKLFTQKYPLAWGTDSVQVDAFLTGTVAISPDGKTTTISVEAFDKKNLKLRPVIKPLEVKTDTSILRDTNQSFVVSRKLAKRAFGEEDTDEAVNNLATENAQTQNQTNSSRKVTVEQMKEWLEFKIKYNDQEAQVTSDGFLDKPTAGQKVVINLTAKVKLGLLLRVNGVNTLSEQRDEKSNLREYFWWVLEPNKEYGIQGFYTNGKVFDFIAKTAAEVPVSEMGENADRHGKIDFDVFVDPSSIGATGTPLERRSFSFRTLNTRAASFSQAKAQVTKALQPNKKPTPRTFITKDANGRDQVLETTTFEGQHVGGLSVNYRRDLLGGTAGE